MERQAAIYVRISEDKTGAGLGIERQEADCRALAGRLGWDVVEPIYSDNDVSAYSGKPRPGYRRLLADLRTGVADAVLCWHTDRLHRSPVELEEYIEVCQPREIPTQTVKAGPLDLATPSGRLMARQLGAYARFESEHHSDRAKRARLQAATDGRWLGGLRPFGYGADGMTLIEAEAEAIRWMAAEVLAGNSLRSIARKLNAEGTFTSQGRPWTPRAVALLLQRPRNAGLSQHQGEPIGPARWPAILDSDTWRGVVAVLGDPARNTTTSRARRWLLSGLALCGVCGKPVRSGGVAVRGDRRVPSYTCPAGHVRRNAVELDDYVEVVVVERLSQPDAAELLAPDQTGDVAALHAQDAGLRARLDELGRLYGDGVIDALQLASGTAAIRTQREQVTASLAAASRSGVLQGVADAPDPSTVWEGLDLSRRRAIVDVLLEVTILRTKRGGARRKGETSFDPASVAIEWKRG
ncbi:MAG TPA: recombinase family protein [Actinomycetes bacterium]|nr:recombinase family protein [Actinomycetes bacterium]